MMEQKDYIMREIEKIGLTLRAILNKLIGQENYFEINIYSQAEIANKQLNSDIDFDFNKFILLDESEVHNFISQYNGMNKDNLELLADIIFQISKNELSEIKKTYLEKSLQLYNLCNLTDKTFSVDRENKISNIKNTLSI